MSERPKSLLAAEAASLMAAAPFLFSEEEMGQEFIGPPAERGVYNAERLFKERPEVYREIVRLRVEGQSIRGIKRMCKVHHRTVEAVMVREGETIDTLKKELGARCFRVSGQLLESIEEDVENNKLKPEAKAVAFGIIAEKAQLLTGGVTQRVERVDVPDEDSLAKMIDDLPQIDVAAVQTSGMGFGAGGVEQRADALGAGAVGHVNTPVEGRGNTGDGRTGDERSPAFEGSTQGDGADGTYDPTSEASKTGDLAGDRTQGRGGSRNSEGGASGVLDSEGRNL